MTNPKTITEIKGGKMEKIKELYNKFVNRETITYLIFGVLTTLLNYFVAFLVMHFCTNIGYELRVNVSTITAWWVAVIFAYVTNKIFVFQSKTRDIVSIAKELGAFLTARLLSFGFEIVYMNITVNLLRLPFGTSALSDWNFYINKMVAQVVIVILNYIFSKLFIFKKKEDKKIEQQ